MMKTVTEEQHEFLIAARLAFRHCGEPEAPGHMRAAEKAWRKMVKAESEYQKREKAA